MNIHSTAIVDSKAVIEDDVTIGEFSIIRENVKIRKGTKIGSHVVIERGVEIGEDCNIMHGSIIGCDPQDLKFKSETPSGVKIGKRNTIREFVTIHRSSKENCNTIIGDENFIMANAHIAHDCIIGNKVIITNYAGLTGHVIVEDKAFISGLSGIHQFTRIGTMSIIGGCSKVVQDVPPYLVADGNPARACGVNVIGLRRNGIPSEDRLLIQKAYKILYRSNLNTSQALTRIKDEIKNNELINHFVKFIGESKRGIC